MVLFVGSSVLAAQAGGLGLVSGMTLFAGALMVGLSGVVDRMRPFLPTEVIGVIVLMVGISLLPGSLRSVLAVPEGSEGVTRSEVIAVFILSFGTMAVIMAEALTMRGADAVRIDLTFDEFSIRAKARFDGPPLPFPAERPSKALLVESDEGLALLSGYLIRSFCNQIEQRTADGKTILDMRFEH